MTGCDKTAPVVTLNGESPMEILQGTSYSELGAFSDGGEEVTITGAVNPDKPGTYTLTYTATDKAGNVGTATREVTVTFNPDAPSPLVQDDCGGWRPSTCGKDIHFAVIDGEYDP